MMGYAKILLWKVQWTGPRFFLGPNKIATKFTSLARGDASACPLRDATAASACQPTQVTRRRSRYPALLHLLVPDRAAANAEHKAVGPVFARGDRLERSVEPFRGTWASTKKHTSPLPTSRA